LCCYKCCSPSFFCIVFYSTVLDFLEILFFFYSSITSLTETTSFTFRFQKTEDIVFTNGTLDVTDDGTVGIVHEFNADLGDTTTRTGTAENLCNSSELDGGLVRRSVLFEKVSLISELIHLGSKGMK
jgi:hypothetical protein